MTQLMNPVEVANALRDAYLRYLETSFFLKDPLLRTQFVELLRDKTQPPLLRTPILEISPGFKVSSDLAGLVRNGVLSQSFSELGQQTLERPLYKHQERALGKAISERRNLIIATGTGSGKTECFLYPILNYLLTEKENGTLPQPGVRALLLYPMNALANDQIARLREIAAVFPEITFGRYTGETKQSYKEALVQYRSYHGREPLANELICRDQMQVSPPHILFTNYAMLEYLLIRPKDSSLFEGGLWRFLVLDEVHTYSGALGAEIAMLMRRLRERVARSELGRLQCIGTSATLGAGEQDYPKIASFASNLFGEDFDKEDVIGPEHVRLTKIGTPWGSGSPELYASLRNAVFDKGDLDLDILQDISRAFLPEDAFSKANDATKGIDNEVKAQCQAFLYELLQGDERVQLLRQRLDEDRAVELDELDDFGGLVDLVALGAFARKPGSVMPLVPARYHIMGRAISGVYAWFDDQGQLQLIPKRARRWQSDGGTYIVFELASCNRCGEVMLVCEVKSENGLDYLQQPPGVGDDPIVELKWYMLRPDEHRVDEDDVVEEANEKFPGKAVRPSPKRMCRICGRINDATTFDMDSCDGHQSNPIEVYELENKSRRSTPRVCLSCGNNHGSVASRVLTGKEVPVAVLATALYQKVPPSPKWEEQRHPGAGRKLMMFSDSRQDAAFFAPFMDNTYNKFKQRRYLTQALEQKEESLDLEGWADQAYRRAKEAGQWEEDISPQKQKREAQGWVLREWIATDRRLALEGAGVVKFVLRRPQAFIGLPFLSELPWSLDSDAQWSLIQILLDSLRYQGIVSFGEFGLEHTDEIFKPRNVDCYLRGSSSNPKKRVFAWQPAENRTNKRLDYLRRLLVRRGLTEEDAQVHAIRALKNLWNVVMSPNAPLGALFESGLTHFGESNLWRLKPNWWQVSLAKDSDILRCETCGTVSAFAVENVCPLNNCKGEMQKYSNAERTKNHYHNLFTSMRPVPLAVREHTAQLTKDEAFRAQQDFISGKVNMLSCTTTFEMGVDVGDLQCVFMRNMPPNPGNYIQRAGRAGRRADSAAIIVTYAQRRSHDYAYFDQWHLMVKGAVRPPVIRINNSKIARRHVHAEALAEYYRHHPDAFKDNLQSLFDPAIARLDELLHFVSERPSHLKEKLMRFVPVKLHEELGLDSWTWLDGANGDEDAIRESFGERLRKAKDDVHGDWKSLEKAEEEASQNKNHKGAAMFASQLKTLKRRSLLGKLGTYGLMPKYGFPTEVVELKVRSSSREAGQVDLNRDMKLALSEFAPGNQIVANKKVWTSVGIVLPTGGRKLHQFKYWSCKECQFFFAEHVVATGASDNADTKKCHCGDDIEEERYIYPEFGFTTATASGEQVGESRPPMKTYSDIFFHEGEEERAFTPLESFPAFSFREGGQGWIHVINSNRGNDFFVCETCGFVFNVNPYFSKEKSNTHKKPWNDDKECSNTRLNPLALGYRYRTDVLELRLPDKRLEKLLLSREETHSMWLSTLYALNNAACRALEINERDLGACLHYGRQGHPNMVFFDTAPGGAGFVQEVKDNFIEVVKSAVGIVDKECCGEDTSCISCLRTYFNQRDHNILRRGLARKYLHMIM